MEDALKELLGDFVLLAATIDYGSKFIKWLAKFFTKHKSLRKREAPRAGRCHKPPCLYPITAKS